MKLCCDVTSRVAVLSSLGQNISCQTVSGTVKSLCLLRKLNERAFSSIHVHHGPAAVPRVITRDHRAGNLAQVKQRLSAQRQDTRPSSNLVPVTWSVHGKSTIQRRFSSTTNAQMTTSNGWISAYIALGSNLGDRLGFIEKALDALKAHDSIKFKRTSCLYETRAMYVEDQDNFYNAVCEIETNLAPLSLLDALQDIENSLNRRRTIDKGPRTIDLDILLYGDEIINHERLVVPHKLMTERRFVLEPLCDLIPTHNHPSTPSINYSQLLTRLPPANPPLTPIIPLAPGLTITPLSPTRRTLLMSILNTTPDSFSDGGLHCPPNEPTNGSDNASLTAYESHIHATISAHLAAGASIIDIGGQSTRPHAELLSPDEELRRVLPAVRVAVSVLSSPATATVAKTTPALSIDTFHASVFARLTALFPQQRFILNDVSGGLLSSNASLRAAAKAHSSVILEHMRGDPRTMSKPPHNVYRSPGAVQHPEDDEEEEGKAILTTLTHELNALLDSAANAGLPRWRILLDPGFGFAKVGAAQNIPLLRGLAALRSSAQLEGVGWCAGVSRKGFLGEVVGRWRGQIGKGKKVVEARERDWATAAAVAACVQQGVDVVRVHDVRAMGEVVAVADAVYRS